MSPAAQVLAQGSAECRQARAASEHGLTGDGAQSPAAGTFTSTTPAEKVVHRSDHLPELIVDFDRRYNPKK